MNDLREAPIGVFDSGIGGLTVAREIMRQIPEERIVYFGDTARVPYGSKSGKTIIRYSCQIARFLKTRGVKVIVVACNTASAYALEALQQEMDIPVIGVVRPGARVAARESIGGNIGVIGTAATVGSHIYQKYIQSLRPEAQVFEKACPLFVPLVEEGWRKDPVTRIVAERYLQEMKERKVDTLILGCTHYPLIAPAIAKTLPGVKLISAGAESARMLQQTLAGTGLLSAGKGHAEYYISDDPHAFAKSAKLFLGADVNERVHQVDIEKY